MEKTFKEIIDALLYGEKEKIKGFSQMLSFPVKDDYSYMGDRYAFEKGDILLTYFDTNKNVYHHHKYLDVYLMDKKARRELKVVHIDLLKEQEGQLDETNIKDGPWKKKVNEVIEELCRRVNNHRLEKENELQRKMNYFNGKYELEKEMEETVVYKDLLEAIIDAKKTENNQPVSIYKDIAFKLKTSGSHRGGMRPVYWAELKIELLDEKEETFVIYEDKILEMFYGTEIKLQFDGNWNRVIKEFVSNWKRKKNKQEKNIKKKEEQKRTENEEHFIKKFSV